MRILFVCNEYPPAPHGGQGTFVKQMANAMSEQEDVFVIGFYSQEEFVRSFKDGNVHVSFYKKPMHTGKLAILSNLKQMAKVIDAFIEENKIEIVEYPDSGAMNLFCRNRAKSFIRLHNGEKYILDKIGKKRSILLKWCENICFLKSGVNIIAVSNFILKQFNEFYIIPSSKKNRHHIIYNGIDTNNFRPLKSDRPKEIISFVGTIKPVKGIGVLLQAFNEVMLSNPNVQLHIYGNDTLVDKKSYWEFLVNKYQLKNILEKNIFYNGALPIESMPEIYNGSYICVFPSLLESFGLVAVESMTCGAITVFTENGAGREVIDHGVDGFLVNPDDYLSVYKAITHIYDMPDDTVSALREKAHQKVISSFSIQHCMNQTINLYSNA